MATEPKSPLQSRMCNSVQNNINPFTGQSPINKQDVDMFELICEHNDVADVVKAFKENSNVNPITGRALTETSHKRAFLNALVAYVEGEDTPSPRRDSQSQDRKDSRTPKIVVKTVKTVKTVQSPKTPSVKSVNTPSVKGVKAVKAVKAVESPVKSVRSTRFPSPDHIIPLVTPKPQSQISTVIESVKMLGERFEQINKEVNLDSINEKLLTHAIDLSAIATSISEIQPMKNDIESLKEEIKRIDIRISELYKNMQDSQVVEKSS